MFSGENAKLKFGESVVEEIVFTSKMKETIAFKLKGVMEDHHFKIPSERIIFDDFRKIKKEVLPNGNIRLAVSENDSETDEHSHADYFWAAGLSIFSDSGKEGNINIKSGTKRESGKMLEGYYQ